MRVLLTGAGGFVGRYMTGELLCHGHAVVALDRALPPDLPPGVIRAPADITVPEEVAKAVAAHVPDACIHLAAIAFPPDAASAPTRLLQVNVMGTAHTLEAIRRHAPAARVLVASTARVYGSQTPPAPLAEDAALHPDSLYAASKAAAEQVAAAYATEFGLAPMIVRPHNHIGPGQDPRFCVAAFARQVAAIRRGAAPLLRTGNLDSRRDFLDVRDVAAAYRLLVEAGTPGRTYNLASGVSRPLRDVVNTLLRVGGVEARIETDMALVRPTDGSTPLDLSRIRNDTGWAPTHAWEETLRDILNAA